MSFHYICSIIGASFILSMIALLLFMLNKKIFHYLSYLLASVSFVTSIFVFLFLYIEYHRLRDEELKHIELERAENLKVINENKSDASDIQVKIYSSQVLLKLKTDRLNRLREENDSLLKQLEESESNS